MLVGVISWNEGDVHVYTHILKLSILDVWLIEYVPQGTVCHREEQEIQLDARGRRILTIIGHE